MATSTPRIALVKPNPDPVTGDYVDVGVLNSNADKIDGVISSTVVTSSTRPASPFQGQIILETDTGKMFVRSGTAWLQIAVLVSGTNNLILPGGEFNTTRAAATDTALWATVTGDSVGRMLIRADGRIEMGPGSGSRDVNLYRRGANHLGTDDAFQSGGFCSGAATESVRTTTVTGWTAETLIQSATFNALSGAGYNISIAQHYQSSVVNDLIRVRLRYAPGASVTTAGTLLFVVNPNVDIAARGQLITFSKLFTAPSTGQFTVGVTMERVGTGTGQAYGDAAAAHNSILITGA